MPKRQKVKEMETYEEKYYRLRDEYLDSLEKYLKTGSAIDSEDCHCKNAIFKEYSLTILDKLLAENTDILKRLK